MPRVRHLNPAAYKVLEGGWHTHTHIYIEFLSAKHGKPVRRKTSIRCKTRCIKASCSKPMLSSGRTQVMGASTHLNEVQGIFIWYFAKILGDRDKMTRTDLIWIKSHGIDSEYIAK